MEIGNVLTLLNPSTWSTTQTVATCLFGGSALTKLADKFFIKPYLDKQHPEKLCLSLEKKISIGCNWILRKSVSFNDFLEDYKKKFPESGKLIEDQIIQSMERIKSIVNTTSNNVILNIKK